MFSRPAASQRRPASTRAPATRPAAAPPARQQQSGGMLSGIGSTIAQGMAFGTGSAIAHRAVGAAASAMTGGDDGGAPLETQQMQPMDQQQQLQGACAMDKQMFFECLKVNQGDQKSCSFLYETLQSCQNNQSQMSFQ
mmetsp:Transcript_18887/g.21878  ORF Transcript_18887/g.21878 Transcript_18887/m.21878 type:complete len:138 (-) Transcript_18887:344-757(-)